MMEKHGDPKPALKPRSEMSPAELKVLKYKSIAARNRRKKEMAANKYIEKIANAYDSSPTRYGYQDALDAKLHYLQNTNRDDLLDEAGQARAIATATTLGTGVGGIVGYMKPNRAIVGGGNKYLRALSGAGLGAGAGLLLGGGLAYAAGQGRYDEEEADAVRMMATKELIRRKAQEALDS